MTFKKGNPKPPGSGRQKGTLTAPTRRLIETLEDMGFDAVREFISAVSEIENPRERAGEIAKLFPYMMPRLNLVAIEEKTPEQLEIEALSGAELEARVKQQLLSGEKTNEADQETKENVFKARALARGAKEDF